MKTAFHGNPKKFFGSFFQERTAFLKKSSKKLLDVFVLCLRPWPFDRTRKASVSVEFALVSVFFLFPLMAGGTDFMLALSARSKLNSALHTLYLFAWSDPQNATNRADLQAYIQAVDPGLPASSIALTNDPATDPFTKILCMSPGGNIDSSTPGSLIGNSGSSPCAKNDIEVDNVHYSLQSVINLPVPVPFLPNPLTLTAGGTIQTN